MKFLLERRISVLTKRTTFEIRVLCEVQKRGVRPWLTPVPQQSPSQKPGGGIKNFYLLYIASDPLPCYYLYNLLKGWYLQSCA